jgi:hypothetical protein
LKTDCYFEILQLLGLNLRGTGMFCTYGK